MIFNGEIKPMLKKPSFQKELFFHFKIHVWTKMEINLFNFDERFLLKLRVEISDKL